MTAIETLIEMTEVSQLAFGRRVAKGDSLLFYALSTWQTSKPGRPSLPSERAWPHSARVSRFVAFLKERKWLESVLRYPTAAECGQNHEEGEGICWPSGGRIGRHPAPSKAARGAIVLRQRELLRFARTRPQVSGAIDVALASFSVA